MDWSLVFYIGGAGVFLYAIVRAFQDLERRIEKLEARLEKLERS
jgi:hypothetical protein